MGIWLAAEISLNRKLDNSRRLVCDVTGFWQCKAVGAQKRTGRSNQTFRPNRRALTEARRPRSVNAPRTPRHAHRVEATAVNDRPRSIAPNDHATPTHRGLSDGSNTPKARSNRVLTNE